ncbi:zinc finger protein 2 [Trypanosoma equiperdum]|uniref:Zinc finger protein 2 n=5 Tax=Trypanozoon TaxID=39700 RepID=Q381U0_TRYB2|nr:zinc finger protein 2, putative [Trypanosoma brucei gambiense DAL972]XP_829553.1 uncharacterized protein Tb11.01.6590 [Trypanosoma brucei brucei TREU927]AAK39107.1 zinc finger protein 2 [Trypanosoma brucei rhodesiense]RHW68347.1 zinc finger protein 2 [Trypanosoma brucei equiperdum]SCU65686.1 zinc finger protein 2 [Trypanosoma equiperdum]EAN80441.1 zinc finger protein 2 [Trypanosoma brucei brucei TREU927]CBH18557.1 zinc finger protein 2, putative [Trypanosoma brucei gambiense DAL972]|eukprot:XP_011780821.1 zinc finger protein 2, putative [Trypanosoma brucei gambiense DAL972]
MAFNQRFDRGAQPSYAAVQLPPGWQMAYSVEGEVYYIDHNTRTTHWKIPQEVLNEMYHQGQTYRPSRSRRGIDRSKMKTKMCMNIQNGGKCTWGNACAFAHSSEELAAVPHNGGGQRMRMDPGAHQGNDNGLDNNHLQQ